MMALIVHPLAMGCRRSETEESATVPTNLPTIDSAIAESSAPPKESSTISRPGVDEDDDPAAPRSLPKTGELPNWVKTKPVVILKPDRYAEAIKDQTMVKALSTFQIDRVAICGYENSDVATDVLMIETVTPSDAYGIFELLAKRGGHTVLTADHSVRAMEVGASTWNMLAWQGKMCLRLSFPASAETELNAVAQLCNRIVFSVPAADPPLMLRMMSKESATRAKVWVVRKTSALRAASDFKVNGIAAAGLDGRLGLTGQELLWIASVQAVPGSASEESGGQDDKPALSSLTLDDSPNLMWVAEYQNPEAAQAAYERYKEAMAGSGTDLDRNTKLEPSQGRFLAGTWTMDLETRLPLLPWLMKSLPGEAPGSAASAPAGNPVGSPGTAPAVR